MLCFTKADLPLFKTLKMRSHVLLYRKALSTRLLADDPLKPAEIESLADGIGLALPAA